MGDEPTGNLDTRTVAKLSNCSGVLNSEHNLTVILVTHDLAVARTAHRNLVMRDGDIVCDTTDAVAAATALQSAQEFD